MVARNIRSKPFSDINVTPFVDVMLVLLIIFMVTAPLLTQGVLISLPKINSKVIPPTSVEPLVISIDKNGLIYLDIGQKLDEPISSEKLVNRVVAVLRYQPATKIFLKADELVTYGKVVEIMAKLQYAGVSDVGMITEPYINSE